ncbi:MAG: hypothetical protein AAGG38_11495 [Planctomycetota bacterium]
MSDKPKVGRLNSKQAAKVIHELRRARMDPAERAADLRLRAVAMGGVVVMAVGLYVGDRIGNPYVMGGALAFGVGVFGVALWRASRVYRAGFQRFVVGHMAADGTFLFCPACRSALGDLDDERLRADPPGECPECATVPWRFERPSD